MTGLRRTIDIACPRTCTPEFDTEEMGFSARNLLALAIETITGPGAGLKNLGTSYPPGEFFGISDDMTAFASNWTANRHCMTLPRLSGAHAAA